MSNSTKIFWQFPWSFKQSFLLVFASSLATFLVDIIKPTIIEFPAFPYNLILLFILIIITIIINNTSKKVPFLRFFSSIPASLGAILLFLVLTLAMALVPKSAFAEIGIFSIKNSITYFLSYTYLLFTLGMTILRRLKFRNIKDFAFFLNHFGLWLFLVSAGLGAGDTKTSYMVLFPNQIEWRSELENGKILEHNFAVKLNKFIIRYHEPKLMLFSTKTKKILKQNGKPIIFTLDDNQTFVWNGYTIRSKKIKNKELFTSERYLIEQSVLYLEITSPSGKKTASPITSGNNIMPPLFVKVNEKISIGCMKAEPEKFISKIKIFKKNGKTNSETLEVNKPIYINGWHLYQNNWRYDYINMQYVSILQLVRDPWIFVVYISSFILCFGAVLMIFSKKVRGGQN